MPYPFLKIILNEDDEAENAGIWDDGGGSLAAMGTLDLADISAAALKFQSETYNLSTLKDLLPNMEANHEEEEGELPEWARDDVIPAMNPVIPNESNEIRETKVTDLNSSKKKNLLMEVLFIFISLYCSNILHYNRRPYKLTIPKKTAAHCRILTRQWNLGRSMRPWNPR